MDNQELIKKANYLNSNNIPLFLSKNEKQRVKYISMQAHSNRTISKKIIIQFEELSKIWQNQ